MAKKNKTAADIYRETQPKDVVEGGRPLDSIKITPEEGAFDPSKWGISADTDNMGGTIKTNRATASIVDNDEPEEKPKEKDNDPLKFLTDMTNLWTREDEEAAAKKKKAAQWITAAQMLGDSIAALSNVYWTGKGANAQKFEPGAQKAAAATYQLEQDIRNARENAAKAQYNAALKKYELEMQRQDKKQAQENWQKTFDANEAHRAQQQKNFEATEARLAEQARLNAENEKIRIDIAKQNANIQLKNALDKIMKLAGVTVEKVDPKKDKREKENTSTNNTEPPIQAYSAPADEWGSQWRRCAGLGTTDFSQFKRK